MHHHRSVCSCSLWLLACWVSSCVDARFQCFLPPDSHSLSGLVTMQHSPPPHWSVLTSASSPFFLLAPIRICFRYWLSDHFLYPSSLFLSILPLPPGTQTLGTSRVSLFPNAFTHLPPHGSLAVSWPLQMSVSLSRPPPLLHPSASLTDCNASGDQWSRTAAASGVGDIPGF